MSMTMDGGSGDRSDPNTGVAFNILLWSDDITNSNTQNGGGATITNARQLTWGGAGGFGYKLDGVAGAPLLAANTKYWVRAIIQNDAVQTDTGFFRLNNGVSNQDSANFSVTNTSATFSATFTTPAAVVTSGASININWVANGTWNVAGWQLTTGPALAPFVATTGTAVPAKKAAN